MKKVNYIMVVEWDVWVMLDSCICARRLKGIGELYNDSCYVFI